MVYRAAIVGCGKIGSEFADDPRIKDIYTHAGAYEHCPDTELVAVCDKDRKKLDKCKERWHISGGYSDYVEMIAETEPDIVSVCTPDQTHFEIIRTILTSSNVKAIFAEKPLAFKVNDAEYLANLAENKGVVLAVNYTRRFAEKYCELKKYLNSDTFGNIQTINGYYTKGTVHNGTHWFDLARFLIGEFECVRGYDNRQEKNDDPTFDTYAKFSNGASAYLHSCDETKFSIFEMDILGSNGRVYIKDTDNRFEIYRITDSPYYSGYRSLQLSDTITDILKDALLYAVEDIVQCLKTGRTPKCSGFDGVAALKIARAVCSSVDSGHSVELGL
ncbi:MAG: Gfo/Idh/MocA family oxidoreductase [Methanoregula sp.]